MKFHGQTLKVAARYARKRVGPEDVGDVGWDPVSERSRGMEVRPSLALGQRKGSGTAQLAPEDGVSDFRTGSSGSSVDGGGGPKVSPSTLSAQVPSSPHVSVQVPSSPSPSAQVPPQGSSFDENCVRLEAPDGTQGGRWKFALWRTASAGSPTRLPDEGLGGGTGAMLTMGGFVDDVCDGSQAGSRGGGRNGYV